MARSPVKKGTQASKAKAPTNAKVAAEPKAPDISKLVPVPIPEPDNAKPIECPILNASSLTLTLAGNDVSLILSRNVPAVADGHPLGKLAMVENVAVVQISIQTLKDFSIVFSRTVEQYEKEWGVIETPHTRAMRK